MAVADSADLSPEQKQAVRRAATELTGQELKKCLDILKASDLKYSLVTDLISFAESDKKYSEEEKANVEKISQYLGINEHQFNLLDQFVKKTAETQPEPEEIHKPSFLSASANGWFTAIICRKRFMISNNIIIQRNKLWRPKKKLYIVIVAFDYFKNKYH
jgi:hypothetical protein